MKIKSSIQHHDFSSEMLNKKFEFSDLDTISDESQSLTLIFVTPQKSTSTMREEWVTVADFTEIESEGIDPKELLKYL